MKKKIINAINIHSGGGLTYLYLLHSFLDSKDNILLLDKRVEPHILIFKNAKVFFFKKGPFRNIKIYSLRLKKYLRIYTKSSNKKALEEFSEIYLNGIPPLFRFFPNRVKIFVFLQNKLIFDQVKIKEISKFNLKVLLNIYISKIFLKFFLNKNDILIAQTNSMFRILCSKFKSNRIIKQHEIWGEIEKKNIKIINKLFQNKPSLLISQIKKLSTKNVLFFYPASLYEHKNHKNLIEAIELLDADKVKNFKLILTIKYSELQKFSMKNKSNIVCIDRVDYFDILRIYKYVDYLIFPSTSESFGLPLLEAKINDTKIISSDLDFVYDICSPERVFNPFDIKDIYQQLKLILEINNNL